MTRGHADAKALDRMLRAKDSPGVAAAKKRDAQKIADSVRAPNHRGRKK